MGGAAPPLFVQQLEMVVNLVRDRKREKMGFVSFFTKNPFEEGLLGGEGCAYLPEYVRKRSEKSCLTLD